jgi:mannosyl-oligosaccharide glucosidase
MGGDQVIRILARTRDPSTELLSVATWSLRSMSGKAKASHQALRISFSLTFLPIALTFAKIRESYEGWVERYGQENLPPPFQFYTIETSAGTGNHHLVQKVFEGEFEFDILFSSGASKDEITSKVVTERLQSTISSFDEKFGQVLKPQTPFGSKKYSELSKSLFSNLLGGIGYFYGDWKADRTYAPEYEEENEGFWEEAAEARARVIPKMEEPAELFTSIPSRPFFPRGFLWDEGFHLMPVMDWDVDLAYVFSRSLEIFLLILDSLDIVRSWFRLIDEDGWIAREQILGEEARTKVPAEFQVQYPHYANPPTLFLILTDYIDRLSKAQPSERTSLLLDKETAKAYLSEIYPLLIRHYEWFRRTQQGDLKSYDREAFSQREAYRWRGRTPRHCLPSGLDDYPRAQPPHPGELHIDAISWVGLMAKNLRKIAEFLDESDDAARLLKQEEAIIRNIDDLHWDSKEGVYCDTTIDEFEEDQHICHKGYISLFPFLVGLMKHDDPKIGKLLDVITDPEQLWSDFGIRSLSKSDEHYGTDENYWRSPIWINMNYLVVEKLLVSDFILRRRIIAKQVRNLLKRKDLISSEQRRYIAR